MNLAQRGVKQEENERGKGVPKPSQKRGNSLEGLNIKGNPGRKRGGGSIVVEKETSQKNRARMLKRKKKKKEAGIKNGKSSEVWAKLLEKPEKYRKMDNEDLARLVRSNSKRK